ncbi:ATP-binding protein [Anaerolentibacter hominis]|uniref:ATP-binding protein n=1 Tax=Anaerolentibacter hominis TaxID=3079009 RepID=UPI0031B840BA
MGNWKDTRGRLAEAKTLSSRLMHMHYCEKNPEGVADYFAPQVTWIGAGEEQFLADHDAIEKMFRQFGGTIPRCTIQNEEYEAIQPVSGLYVVSGRMWIETAPDVEMYLRVHQRVTFVFQETAQGLKCAHIHCSNPYQEMVGGEFFPEKIGRQSYDYVQERLLALEAQTVQQNRQMDVVMSSIAGGLKISRDDDTYSFAFVSREAAALFGYTVEEFMEVTGGTAVGAVYPPDLEHALSDCAEAFRDGGVSYSTRYRVRCKDGSLKWIIDSGKKAQDKEGQWMVNSLYLDITQTEEAAERLREQTSLLTSIYDTVPCGILRFVRHNDGTYELISVNQAAISILGYSNLEEGMKDWHDGVLGTVVPEDRAMLKQTYSRLEKIGDRQDRQYRVMWWDGSRRWLDGTNMIVDRTPEGEAVIQRTFVDITERKRLQQQLEREQEMYRVAMEASSDVMFEYLIDSDTFISYEPRHGSGVIRRELADYSRQLAYGHIVYPEDVPAVIDNICNGRAEMFEVRKMIPDGREGEYQWHQVNSRLIEKDGRPFRVVGTIRNIHRMKETLSENNERLHLSQSALQAISGVYMSIFYVNLTKDQYYAVRLPQAYDVLSFPRTGSFTGDLCSGLLPNVREEDRLRVSRVCTGEFLIQSLPLISGHVEVEFRLNDKGRAPSPWLRLEVHPVSADNADIKTVILTLRNVSMEKQKELERLEEEKAAKHALEEAYEGARRANEAKSDFLSRMSHDIRTPMNAILGMTAIAEHQMDNRERMKDCLSKIRVSGNHLLGLINEVLDMSKIESGTVGLCEDSFLLSEMMDDVIQIIRPDADARSLRLSLRSDITDDAVRGDVMRMQQILLNLLSNAVKYTEPGGSISLRAQERSSGRNAIGCYEFIVEDNGIGMSPEFLTKLFSPFERADDSRVSRVQGTGLGMAITRNLVQMMNGTIRVESRLDEGTRFTVTVFLKLEERKEARAESTRQSSRKPFTPGTRVLMAEDNDINREIAQELLKMMGLETACAVNGKEAVDLFAADPPGTYSLILMDIQMPVMDGYEAAAAIRSMGKEGGRRDALTIPIVALTANDFADDAYRAVQAGMNEHVSKPLDVERLTSVLHRWLDRNQN